MRLLLGYNLPYQNKKAGHLKCTVIQSSFTANRKSQPIRHRSLFHYERDRSKKVELLSWIFDHNHRIMKRGFRLLNLGWSDGTSFLPADFILLASVKKEKQLQKAKPAIDKRSCGGHQRREAVQKATEMAVTMLSRGLREEYVLFNPWFSFPSVIDQIAGLRIHVIRHLKPMPKITYFSDDECG